MTVEIAIVIVTSSWLRAFVRTINPHVTTQWCREDAECVCVHSFTIRRIQSCCYTCFVHKIHPGLKWPLPGLFIIADQLKGLRTERFMAVWEQAFGYGHHFALLPLISGLTNSEYNPAGSAQLKNQSAPLFAFPKCPLALHTASIYPQYALCGQRLMLQQESVQGCIFLIYSRGIHSSHLQKYAPLVLWTDKKVAASLLIDPSRLLYC